MRVAGCGFLLQNSAIRIPKSATTSSMSLTVLRPGLHSLLVDCGRPTARHIGLPLGGAADRAAFRLGNALLRNPTGAVALEVTLAGPTVRAEHSTAAVVFGAPFTLEVAGRGAIPAGMTFTIAPGEILTIAGTPTGARAYLCVAGGFDSPNILDSHSALEPVKPGDVLTCRESTITGRSLPFDSFSAHGPRPTAHAEIRVLDGPQRDWFGNDAFFEIPYRVSAKSNRMGLRLEGEPLARRPGELVSEPVAPGAIQVTNDGLPVILGIDGQTIGGYPKIAHVIRADLDRLAQLRAGETIRFVRVTLDEAEAAARERNRQLHEWQIRLSM